MTPLGCEQVEEQIELFALDELGEPERSAVRAHLTGCPRCARSFEETRRLFGLLHINFNEEEQLQRLRERIDATARRRAAAVRVLRFPRPLAALAALLLLSIGLVGPSISPIPSPGVRQGGPEALSPRVTAIAPMMARTGPPEPEFAAPRTLLGGAVVTPSKDAIWHRLGGNQAELSRGTLAVQTGASALQPVVVKTPGGNATATAVVAAFDMTVSPAPDNRAGSVVVRVSAGVVRLRTPSGTMTGSKGTVLRSEAIPLLPRSPVSPHKRGKEP
jgi:hypothetical protein